MGYIKEPAGTDFVVDPMPLKSEERKKISGIIAYYKLTGRKMQLSKTTSRSRITSVRKKESS